MLSLHLRHVVFLLFHILGNCYLKIALAIESNSESSFIEELNFVPLEDGHVIAHFAFTNKFFPTSENLCPKKTEQNYNSEDILSSPTFCNFDIFPNSIANILDQYRLHDFRLSLTKGRWNEKDWGRNPAGGETQNGGELWATFVNDVNKTTKKRWKLLQRAVSGLFCSSTTVIEDSMTINPLSYPIWPTLKGRNGSFDKLKSVEHDNYYNNQTSELFYGFLPREPVCTESINPWLRLNPCRELRGISSLIDAKSLLAADYQSMFLHAFKGCSNSSDDGTCLEPYMELRHGISIVLRSDIQNADKPERFFISLGDLHSEKQIRGQKCPLATDSYIYTTVNPWLIKGIISSDLDEQCSNDDCYFQKLKDIFAVYPQFMKIRKRNIISESVSYIVGHQFDDLFQNARVISDPWVSIPRKRYLFMKLPNDIVSKDLVLSKKYETKNLVSLLRYKTGDSSGYITTQLKNIHKECMVKASIIETIPSFLTVLLHTFSIEVIDNLNGTISTYSLDRLNEKTSHFKLQSTKEDSTTMEYTVEIPPDSLLLISYKVLGKFLSREHFPADPSRGLDIPAAIVTLSISNCEAFDASNSDKKFQSLSWFLNSLLTIDNASSWTIYSDGLLTAIPLPDFSMPYNVISLTSTAISFFLGSLLSIIIKKSGCEMFETESTNKKEKILSKISAKFKRLQFWKKVKNE